MRIKKELMEIKNVDVFLFKVNYLLTKIIELKNELTEEEKNEFKKTQYKLKKIELMLNQNIIQNKNVIFKKQLQNKYMFLKEKEIKKELCGIDLKLIILLEKVICKKIENTINKKRKITNVERKQIEIIVNNFVLKEIKKEINYYLENQNVCLYKNKYKKYIMKINNMFLKENIDFLKYWNTETNEIIMNFEINKLIENSILEIFDKNI